jgi:hypothetical protein
MPAGSPPGMLGNKAAKRQSRTGETNPPLTAGKETP